MKKILFIALAALTIISCQGGKEVLTLNLEKGTTYYQTSNSQANIVQTISGNEMNLNMNIYGTTSFKVLDETNDTYEMEVRYLDLVLGIKMPQGAMEFSSKNPQEGDYMSMALGTMIDKPFFLTLSKSGKPLKVTQFDAILNQMIESFDQIPPMQMEQLTSQIKESYGEESIISNLEIAMAVLSEEPVAIGSKWNMSTEIKTGFKGNIEVEYSYDNQTDETINLSGVGSISTTDSTEVVMAGGMETTNSLNGSFTSTIVLDAKTRWIKKAEVVQDIKGTTTILSNPQFPDGYAIPMKIKNTTIITDTLSE